MLKRHRSLSLAALLLVVPLTTQATIIDYSVTSLGGNHYRYDYEVTNDSVSLGIGDVLIYFDYGLFDNLSNPLAPAGWDPLAFDPIPSLSLDGLYDALALFAGERETIPA